MPTGVSFGKSEILHPLPAGDSRAQPSAGACRLQANSSGNRVARRTGLPRIDSGMPFTADPRRSRSAPASCAADAGFAGPRLTRFHRQQVGQFLGHLPMLINAGRPGRRADRRAEVTAEAGVCGPLRRTRSPGSAASPRLLRTGAGSDASTAHRPAPGGDRQACTRQLSTRLRWKHPPLAP